MNQLFARYVTLTWIHREYLEVVAGAVCPSLESWSLFRSLSMPQFLQKDDTCLTFVIHEYFSMKPKVSLPSNAFLTDKFPHTNTHLLCFNAYMPSPTNAMRTSVSVGVPCRFLNKTKTFFTPNTASGRLMCRNELPSLILLCICCQLGSADTKHQ